MSDRADDEPAAVNAEHVETAPQQQAEEAVATEEEEQPPHEAALTAEEEEEETAHSPAEARDEAPVPPVQEEVAATTATTDQHDEPSTAVAQGEAAINHSSAHSHSRGGEDLAPIVVPAYTNNDGAQEGGEQLPDGTFTGKHAEIVDRLGHLFLYVSIPFSIIAAGLAIGLYTTHHVHAVTVSHAIAGMCAFTSLVLTSIQVFMHLSVYTKPNRQRYIIRILLMCPIYAIDSFVGLMAYKYATVVNLIRDSYESYVIYMFFMLLMDFLGGEEETLKQWAATKPTMSHLFPFCCLPHVKLNRSTLNIWKFCLLQYMIINPLVTLVSIPLIFTDRYDEGDLAPSSAYAWFTVVEFVSVTFAFTSLVYFFFGSKHLLMPHDPLPKFAAIKTVVFLSFWQTVLLAALNHFKVIPHTKSWTSSEVATGLGNFVLCVEMYLITIAHRWIFSDKPYHPESGRSFLSWAALKHAFDVTDVIRDTRQTAEMLATPLTGGPSPAQQQRTDVDDASQVSLQPSSVSTTTASPTDPADTKVIVVEEEVERGLRE